MFTLSQNKYKKGILAAIIVALAVPILASAEIQWGVLAYDYLVQNQGSLTAGYPFEHKINGASPNNSNLAINAIIKPEPTWFSGSSLSKMTFHISKDSDLDLDNISPDHHVLSFLFSSTAKEIDIAFNVLQNNISMLEIERINQDGTIESPIPYTTINNTLGSFANTNDKNQALYVCASYDNNIQVVKLGCTLLKKNIINQGQQGDTNNGQEGDTNNGQEGDTNNGQEGDTENINQQSGAMEFEKLQNPLCATTGDSTICSKPIDSVTDFIERILNIVVMIGMPIVVLALIWSGFLYVKAQGNSGKIKEAHTTLLWTVVGAGLLMGSWAIANAIKQTVVDIGTGAGLSSSVTVENNLG